MNQNKRHNELQHAIVQVLVLKYRALVAQTDAGITAKYGIKRSSGMPAGWPDLVAFLDHGVVIGIEVKTGKGKLTVAQRAMADEWMMRGHVYLCARTIDDVIREADAALSERGQP